MPFVFGGQLLSKIPRKGLKPALQLDKNYYASRQLSRDYHVLDATTDFREIIDRDDIDVVVIVTPGH